MRTVKVTITFEMETSAQDEEMLKEDVFNYLQDEMAQDTLEYKVKDLEDDEEEDEDY